MKTSLRIADRSLSYTDIYVSTVPGAAAFFGNRSLVVHDKNLTRITCANFTLQSNSANPTGSGNSSQPSPTSSSGSTGVGSSPIATYTGGAITNSLTIGAGVLGLIAFLL